MSFVSFHMFVTLRLGFFLFIVASVSLFCCVTYVNLENIFEFHLNAIFVSTITYAMMRQYTFVYAWNAYGFAM